MALDTSIPVILKATDPKRIEFSMTLTLSLEAWIALKAQLEGNESTRWDWPSRGLISGIERAVEKAMASYNITIEKPVETIPVPALGAAKTEKKK